MSEGIINMRVLFIQPSYYPADPSSGPNLSLHLLARTLVRKGIDVTVFTTNYDVNLKPDVEHYVDGVRVIYFRVLLRSCLGEISLKMYKRLRKEISNYDVVYITPIWNPILWYPMGLVVKEGVPFIVSPRGALYPDVVRKRKPILKKAVFKLIRLCIKKATYIHYTTEDEKETVQNYWRIKVPAIVIPNGIDLRNFGNLPPKGFFKKNFGIEGRYILHLGRINWKKGLDITADVFNSLIKEYPDLKWVIAGRDDGYKNILLRQLRSLGCEDKVKFVGVLQGEDKFGAFMDAEVVVLPSYSENFGMAVVEAMACETPVLISNKVGIYREVEKFNAGLVVDPNVEEVYQGIKSILDNEALRRKIAFNGRNLVREHYDIEKVADKFINEICRDNG